MVFGIGKDNEMEVQLSKLQPNLAGELLRDKIFNQVNNKKGCYSTFEINYDFKIVDKSDGRIQKLWKYLFDEYEIDEYDDFQEEISSANIVENDDLIAMWYWDGDGTLLIYVKAENILFVNEDCKKDYTWKIKKNIK